mmetsp:Transcript_30816/g.98227  ORF Transcript_30816/g.98227 Transcript_30816/m.98227 type:complete len:277 (-) Transcript_30816:476-1306(-)
MVWRRNGWADLVANTPKLLLHGQRLSVVPHHALREAIGPQGLVVPRERDAVRKWPRRHHRNEPIWPEDAEDLRKVRGNGTHVERIWHVVIVAFDGRGVHRGKVEMLREHWREECKEPKGKYTEGQKRENVADAQLWCLPEEVVFQAQHGSPAVQKLGKRSEKRYQASGECVDHQQEEKLVVHVTNAVVDPGAMVIHAEHANATNVAVVGPLRPREATLLAKRRLPRLPLQPRGCNWQRRPYVLDKLLPPGRNQSRVRAVGPEIAPQGQAVDGVEEH